MGSDPRSDEWRYPEGNEDTPPAPAMPEVKGICASCGDPLDSGFLCSKCNGDDDVAAELTTLRQRLAEAQADAARWEEAARVLGELCVATNLNKKCEEMGETDNPEVVESQMSAMGRLGSAYLAALSNPTASALVREGGGGA